MKGKSERGELHAERKIKKERKKAGKDRKTCTHTHTHLRIEFIRVNSAAGTRRVARERESASSRNRYRRAGICSAAGYNEKITAFAAVICTRAHVHRRRCASGVCERERTRGYVRATAFIISSPSGTRPARIKRGASTRVTRLLPATPITQTPPRGLVTTLQVSLLLPWPRWVYVDKSAENNFPCFFLLLFFFLLAPLRED